MSKSLFKKKLLIVLLKLYNNCPSILRNKLISYLNLRTRYKFLTIIKNKLVQKKLDEINNQFQEHEFLIEKNFSKVKDDYLIKYIPRELNSRIKKFIDQLDSINGESLKSKFKEEFHNNSYLLLTKQKNENVEKLSNGIISDAYELDHNNNLIKEIHEEIRRLFVDYFISPISIINSRAWWDKSNAISFGPNRFHYDGFSPGHLKVMIYPYGLSEERGGFYIDKELITNQKEGCCVAFRNSDVPHHHLSGSGRRLTLEFTIFRTFKPINQFTPSHFNGRHYSNPLSAYLYSETKCNKLPKYCSRLINIGSGFGSPEWSNWLLFDALKSPYVHNFFVTKNSIFPVFSKSADLIYSSHHIEHLDDDSFLNIINESHRILKKDGFLLFKFPDYDFFLEEYKSGEKEFMQNKGIESITWSWANKKLEDNLENRIAMMFCGYWNYDYGDQFSNQINFNDKAYHGPPKITIEKLKELFKNSTPSNICKFLVKEVKKDHEFKAFNHQNAWSREEMKLILEQKGFKLISQSKEEIFNIVGFKIPDFFAMSDWSSYMLFKPN